MDQTAVDKTRAQLKTDEGFRGKPYQDSLGNLTIGYGWCLVKAPMRESEASIRLDNDIHEALEQLEGLPWFPTLDPVRQSVLVNLAFNMGFHGLLEFRRMLAAIREGRWSDARAELLNSVWADQVQESRSARLAGMLMTGEWPGVSG